jgi:hypothetical protein
VVASGDAFALDIFMPMTVPPKFDHYRGVADVELAAGTYPASVACLAVGAARSGVADGGRRRGEVGVLR